MSGKSNFLDFFKFVQDLVFPAQGMTSGLQSALNIRGGFERVIWNGAGSNSIISFSLEGDQGNDEQKFDWKYEVQLLGNRWGAQVAKPCNKTERGLAFFN